MTRTAPATRPYRLTVFYRSTRGGLEMQSRRNYATHEAAHRAAEAAIARGRASCTWREAFIVDARDGSHVGSLSTGAR